MMSTLRRTMIAGMGLTASLVLAGCAGSSGTESTGSNSKSTQPTASQASGGVEIAAPKDATAGEPCALLTPDAAAAVGVSPQGKADSDSIVSDAAKACVWKGEDGSKSVALTPIKNRSIQAYYQNPDSYVDFQKLEIAGHPAVRANKTDPMAGGSCDIFLASKKNQVVQATTYVPSEKVGQVDPCKISKKALMLSVSSWPAAK